MRTIGGLKSVGPAHYPVVVYQITYHVIGFRQRQYHMKGEIFPTHQEARAWGATHKPPIAEHSRYGHPRRKKGDDGFISQEHLREWEGGAKAGWLRGFSIDAVQALTADGRTFVLVTGHTTLKIQGSKE